MIKMIIIIGLGFIIEEKQETSQFLNKTLKLNTREKCRRAREEEDFWKRNSFAQKWNLV